eukprot:TRINITY_DN8004_c0_g1_i2.p1 TRINITY_DN8004_c0_g1~~TRINITY_DN8004_c0_g1_i2.p1  ORF type:complete len:440 (+),score=82.12 TRINITY_DN8004_c0_g1_i2:2-1321(+)
MADANDRIEIGKHVVIVAKHQHYLKLVRVQKDEKVKLGKWRFALDEAIGSPYGSLFELVRGRLEPREHRSTEEENAEFHVESGQDNRGLIPTPANQKLDMEKIHAMRKEGVTGASMVKELVANSKSFKSKHEFSQRKYLQRKKEAHVLLLELARPTIRQLQEVYYQFMPEKIEHLRADSLASVLLHANVQPGRRVLVFETCMGLVSAAAVQQLGDSGRVVALHTGSQMPQLISGCDFPPDIMARILPLSINRLPDVMQARKAFIEGKEPEIPDITSGSKRSCAFGEMVYGQFDSLIIATALEPANIIRRLLKFLAPSAQYSFYHPFREPLVEAIPEVKGISVLYQLYENFLRFHQVLPQRTHPMMTTEPRGGTLLRGTTTAAVATLASFELFHKHYPKALLRHGGSPGVNSASKQASNAASTDATAEGDNQPSTKKAKT